MKQYSFSKSIVLHLLPGALGTVAYVFLAPIFMNNGYPAMFEKIRQVFAKHACRIFIS